MAARRYEFNISTREDKIRISKRPCNFLFIIYFVFILCFSGGKVSYQSHVTNMEMVRSDWLFFISPRVIDMRG